MSTSLVGLSPGPARVLASEIGSWAGSVTDTQGAVIEAESLSDLPTMTTAALDQVRDDLVRLARAITIAADEVESHESTFVHFRPRIRRRMSAGGGSTEDPAERKRRQAARDQAAVEAQAVLDQIQAAATDGLPVHISIEENLRDIFGGIIDDDAVAAAALGFALQGLPASQALRLESEFDVDTLLSQLAGAMAAGTHPAKLGELTPLLPQAYQDWHELNDTIESFRFVVDDPSQHAVERLAAEMQLHIRLEQQAELRVAGFGQDAFAPGPTGELIPFAAIGAVARELGLATHSWAGAQYAPSSEVRWDETETERIGEIAIGSQAFANGMFNELGASGTGSLPTLFDARGPDHVKAMTALYSQALAQVAGPELNFTGRDLIAQNTFDLGGVADLISPAELMLVADGFDPDFLLGAVATSLRLRPPEWHLLPTDPETLTPFDPRLAALAALAINDATPALVRELAASGELDLLLLPEPHGSYGIQSPNLPNAEALQGLSATHVAIAQVGLDRHAMHDVIDHMAANRHLYQLGSNVEFPLRDLGITNGLSSMLALGASGYIHRSANDQRKFFDVYIAVVRSGAGLELAIVGSASLFEHEVNRQLSAATNPQDIDLTAAGDFVMTAERTRLEQLRNSSTIRDAAADNYERLLAIGGLAASGTGIAAGIAAGSALFGPVGAGAVVISLLLGGLSLLGSDDDNREDYHQQAQLEALNIQPNIHYQLLVGALASGVVVTEAGERVVLVETGLDPNYQRTFEVYVGGKLIPREIKTVTRHDAWMDDMWVGTEPLEHFAARLNDVAMDIDETLADQEREAAAND